MALTICLHCDEMYPESAACCSKCGRTVQQQLQTVVPFSVVRLVKVIIFYVIGMFFIIKLDYPINTIVSVLLLTVNMMLFIVFNVLNGEINLNYKEIRLKDDSIKLLKKQIDKLTLDRDAYPAMNKEIIFTAEGGYKIVEN